MIQIILSILYVVLLSIILFLSFKQYFSDSSRYEDYYIVLAALCTLFKYSLLFIFQVFNIYFAPITLSLHLLETFTYWFIMIFLYKHISFKSRNQSRLINILLVLLQITIFTGWTLFFDPIGIMANWPTDVILAMKLNTINIPCLSLFFSFSQLLLIIIDLVISKKLKDKLMMLTFSFLFAHKSIHITNELAYSAMSAFLFNIEQTLKFIAILSLGITIYLYYKDRLEINKKHLKKRRENDHINSN